MKYAVHISNIYMTINTLFFTGLASLCSGCLSLKYLACSGVFQLADPRQSVPMVNNKSAAWETLVGVAAVAKYCPDIEHLDLSGCFRLNKSIQRYVSRLSELKTLILSGCLVSPEALVTVAEKCPLITELNLSDCGKGVNGIALQAIAKHCKGLKSIHLG